MLFWVCLHKTDIRLKLILFLIIFYLCNLFSIQKSFHAINVIFWVSKGPDAIFYDPQTMKKLTKLEEEEELGL